MSDSDQKTTDKEVEKALAYMDKHRANMRRYAKKRYDEMKRQAAGLHKNESTKAEQLVAMIEQQFNKSEIRKLINLLLEKI